ncbi:hypothetical protein ACFPAA_27225, partial [Paraburkholderia caffeinitolerans]
RSGGRTQERQKQTSLKPDISIEPEVGHLNLAGTFGVTAFLKCRVLAICRCRVFDYWQAGADFTHTRSRTTDSSRAIHFEP